FFTFGGTNTANLNPGLTPTNYVYGSAGDTANFSDSSGNDEFDAVARYGYSIMSGTGYYNEAIGIGTVMATSSNGGADQANFYDTAGSDVFDATDDHSSLSGGGFLNQANGF